MIFRTNIGPVGSVNNFCERFGKKTNTFFHFKLIYNVRLKYVIIDLNYFIN